jgi:hypothetical protein
MRTVAVFDAAAVKGTEWEPHVAAVIAVERSVHAFQPASGLWKTSHETAFYLSNRPIAAKVAADAVSRVKWPLAVCGVTPATPASSEAVNARPSIRACSFPARAGSPARAAISANIA